MDFQKSLKNVWSALFPTAEERAEQEKRSQIKLTEQNLSMAARGKEYDHEAHAHYNSVIMMGGWGVGTVPIYKDFGSKAEQAASITKLSNSLIQLGVSQSRIDTIIKSA